MFGLRYPGQALASSGTNRPPMPRLPFRQPVKQSGLRRTPGPDNRCECLHLSLLWFASPAADGGTPSLICLQWHIVMNGRDSIVPRRHGGMPQ